MRGAAMTVEIALVLILLAATLTVFAKEWLSVDAATLLLVVALVVSGVLTPAEAFAGFSSDAIIILACIFVLTGAVLKAGVMELLGRMLDRLGRASEPRGALTLFGISASVSALISNTSATAVLMPASLEAARRAAISPSRVLMPLAYASILGGSCTLIGTSTNLAGSGMAERLGLEAFSLFEFAAIGIITAGAGILWLAFPGRLFLPERKPAGLAEEYGLREFLSTLLIPPESAALGRTISELAFDKQEIDPIALVRGERQLTPRAFQILREGDELIVKGSRDALLKLKDDKRFVIEAETRLKERDVGRHDVKVAEAVLLPQSMLVGKTLKSIAFFRRFGAVVLAIHRRGTAYPFKIENIRLKVGDVLLLQGESDEIERLGGNQDLWALTELSEPVLSRRQGFFALAALGGAVAAGASGLVPLSIAMLCAVLAIVVSGCISMEEAYRFIDWRLLVLIGGMSSFGVAMTSTGAAEFLADAIVSLCLPFGVTASLAAFSVLTILLTQPLSNAAAALAVMPVAVAAAGAFDADPRSFAVLVTLSASLSFITPFEPACLLVYGPGKYRFMDFVRAGLPLTALCTTLLVLLVPVFWPLR